MPFTSQQEAALARYFTNLDRPVFALRNLPEVVKGALFSRYSRTEKSLREVLLTEFIEEPASGFGDLVGEPAGDDLVAARRAEEFYERVLVGYGDDSVAELAGAHLACEQVSTLAAKALEDSRIGLSPLEKSTRYVRFDRPGEDGRFLYYRGPELAAPEYEPAMDALFRTYSELVMPLTEAVRDAYPIEEGETERGWKSATRAKALDLLRGLLPAATLTNVGLYGNGRAFEYLVTKLAAHELPECGRLAEDIHTELSMVIPAFVRRALDEKYGRPAAQRLREVRGRIAKQTPSPVMGQGRGGAGAGPQVRLLEWDPDAERKVAAAALYAGSDRPWSDLDGEPGAILDALLAGRRNRRDRAPRPLEHAVYLFEIEANFGAYRDLHRHRMLSQERQHLGTSLGFDAPDGLDRFGFGDTFRRAIEAAAAAHAKLESRLGSELAQYAVPLAFRLRWHARLNLRELYHLCELRTTPQGHPDYRWVAQEMFKAVEKVHPRLASYASFVDLSAGDELERRASEKRLDQKLSRL
jgi:thymidylate synthase ThyX